MSVRRVRTAHALVAAHPATTATPTAPFTECPAVGAAASCDVLIQVTDGGNRILDDPNQGPYDGADDTLIGVVNNSSTTISSLALSSNTDLFNFDGDGLCTYGVPGCPFGSTGYEGPNTTFSGITQDTSGGFVNFDGGLAPGATAYFSLEERLTATAVVAGGPSAVEQGRLVNASEHTTTCSILAPVNCATGDFWHQFTDFSVPGRGVPLALQRSYDAAAAATDGPLGFGWTDGYAMSLAVDQTGAIEITQEDGAQVAFQPNGSGGFTAAPRVLASLVSNPDGTYTFTRKPDQVQFVFSGAGQLLSEVDRNDYTTTLIYTGSQLNKVTDPAGRQLSFAYSGSHLTKATDPLGRTMTYGYDGSGNLTSTTDAAGATWQFSYDASHRLLTMIDPRGGTTTNVYDGSGRVSSQADPLGRTTTWSYVGDAVSPGGGTTTVTDPNGNITTYDYANLELQDVTHATGTAAAATTSYTYDPATLGVASTTDPNGNVTTNTYDADGNLTSTTDPLGRTTLYQYDNLDDLTSKELPSGATTIYTYDGAGNLTGVTDAAGHSSSYSYDDPTHPGDATRVTDWDGRVTTLTYDAQGDTASTTVSPSNGVTQTTVSAYDADGERYCQASAKATAAGLACPAPGAPPVAGTASTTYDPVGRVLTTTDADGHTTHYAYDASGNRTKITDAAGHATIYAFDADNELTSLTRADGTSLSYGYDEDGNQITQTDGAGHTTIYNFDALNRQTTAIDPLGRASTMSYDLAGNKVATTDASGRLTSYSYDPANQLSGITYSDGVTPAVSYTYTADGQRASMVDGTGTTTYAYDSLDQLSGQTNGAGATVLYSRDNSGNVTSLTSPDGQVVTKTYDGAGREDTLTDGLGKTFTFGYDANGNLTSQADPNGVTATSAYDTADQLTAISDKTATSTLASYSYSRNQLGQLTAAASTGVPGTPETYSYSSLNQLASVNGATYSFDQADNLIKLSDGTTQTFDAASELTKSTPPAGPPAPRFATDQVVVTDQPTAGRAITSRSVATRAPGELVVVLVSANGPSTRVQSITKVTGAGLTFKLASRATATGYGTAEVWQAYTPNKIAGPITATLAWPSYDGSIAVETFTGAAPAVTAARAARTFSAKPAVALTPTTSGSLILAAGHDWSHAAKVTPARGQTLIHLWQNIRSHNSYWIQRATLDVKGRVVTVADALPNADRWELAAVEVAPAKPAPGPAATTYTYDQQGNRTSATPTGGVATVLRYDQANHLTSYGSAATYVYDGDGLRAAKTVSGHTSNFTWDQSGSLPLLLQDGTDTYVYGPDGTPLERITNSTPTYLFRDQQGSTRLLTSPTGTVTGTYSYDAYGRTTAHTGVSVSLQYDGQYTDAESGYQYLRARYYQPLTGSFVTLDPLAQVTHSPYSYASNNPLSLSDPSGLCSWWNVFCHLFSSSPKAPAPTCTVSPLDWWGFSSPGKGSGSQTFPNFKDSTQPPGPGWEWRGKSPVGSGQGSWYNPSTDQSLHPDLEHDLPKGPHYDYKGPDTNGETIPLWEGEPVPDVGSVEIPEFPDFPLPLE